MAGKIFSSREDDENTIDITSLQDFVFLVHDVIGNQEPPAEDPVDLMVQLDIGLVTMAERIDQMNSVITTATMDILSLTLRTSKMMNELRTSVLVLDALAEVPNDDEPFLSALRVLKREGEPDVRTIPSSSYAGVDTVELDVELAFTEEKLAEALRYAINTYINERAQATLANI